MNVLNLIINGLPSIQKKYSNITRCSSKVLNLIINGLPSILCSCKISSSVFFSFVLNLIINGLPSIPLPKG